MKRKVSELTNHPLNKEIYSLSDIDDLKKSIQEVGLLQPIIINSKNVILSGHRRYLSIKELGWEYIEVIINDIKEEDVALYLISYNKQRIKSIKEQLLEIKHLHSYYSKGQGFRSDKLTSDNVGRSSTRSKISDSIGLSSGQIQKILFIDQHRPDFIDLIDKGILTTNQAYIQTTRIVKENETIYQVKPTDIKINNSRNNRVRLFNSSSHKMIDLKDEEVQMIFTSPPYFNKRIYDKNGGLGNEKTPDEYIRNLTNHLKDCYRVLNKRGSFFLNLGDTFYNYNLQNIPHRVIIELQKQGWILRNNIIWKKLNPKPSQSKNNLTPSYEYIFHLVKSKDYYYNQIKIPCNTKGKPSHPPSHRNIKNIKTSSFSPYIPSEKGKNISDFWSDDIIQTSVYNQRNNLPDFEHPAPFPKEISILPILQTTKENDLVLDPFCGISNTGLSCLTLNRRYVGYDIQESFINYSRETVLKEYI